MEVTMSDQTLSFRLYPRRRVIGQMFGDARGFRHGRGIEQVSAKLYELRDDPRRIDWQATQRLFDVDDDELIVRQQLRTESLGVVIITDRTVTMMDPDSKSVLGLLPKHSTAIEAGQQIVRSATGQRGAIGYRDFAHGELFLRRANGKTNIQKVREKYLTHKHFLALPGMLAEHLQEFTSLKGAFVFVLSDFLDETLLDTDLWEGLIFRGYDPVPVLIQDPTWECTFPDAVSGLILPFRSPVTGRLEDRRYSKKAAVIQKQENEERLENIRETFRDARIDWVELTEENPDGINRKFREWSTARKRRKF